MWSIPRPHLIGPSQRPSAASTSSVAAPTLVWLTSKSSVSISKQSLPSCPFHTSYTLGTSVPSDGLPSRPLHDSRAPEPLPPSYQSWQQRCRSFRGGAVGDQEGGNGISGTCGPKSRHLHHLEQSLLPQHPSDKSCGTLGWHPSTPTPVEHPEAAAALSQCLVFLTFCPSFQWACHSLKLTLILTSCSAPSSEILNSEASPRQVNDLMQHLGFTCSTDTQHTSTKVSRHFRLPDTVALLLASSWRGPVPFRLLHLLSVV